MILNVSLKQGTTSFYAILLIAASVCWLVHAMASSPGAGIEGGCQQPFNPFLQQAGHPLLRAITYCAEGDADRATLRSGEFPPGTARIRLEVAGYPDTPGLDVYFLASDGQRTKVKLPNAGEMWRKVDIFVPERVRQKTFRLVAQDDAPGLKGWAGLAVMSYSRLAEDTRVMGLALVALGSLHFLFLELLIFARRFFHTEAAIIYGLVALGLISYTSFWLYYVAKGPGLAFSGAVLAAILVHAFARLLHPSSQTGAIRDLHAALIPVTASTGLLFIVGFYPYPVFWDTWQYAGSRWMDLPIDNWLPKIFADQVWQGAITRPMTGDWLSSDRPPLQTGFTLLLRPLSAQPGWYQLCAMWLQATVLIPVSLLASRVGLSKVRAWVLMLVATSALLLYNGVFVWPKLIAATYGLIFYFCLFCSDALQLRSRQITFLAGASAALTMLSHGGGFFALAGTALAFVCQRQRRNWRALLATGCIGVALYSPWAAYQKFIDPPGTRLIAWHLAGVQAPTNEPVSRVVRSAYAKLTPAEWAEGRFKNVKTLFFGTLDFYRDVWSSTHGPDRREARERVRHKSFSYLTYSLWFFSPLLWLIALLRRRYSIDSDLIHSRQLLTALIMSLLVWALLMYVPGQTIIHQGSYAANIMAMMLGYAGAYMLSRALFYALATLNVMTFIYFFASWPHPQPFGVANNQQVAHGPAFWLALLICLAAPFFYKPAAKGDAIASKLNRHESPFELI